MAACYKYSNVPQDALYQCAALDESLKLVGCNKVRDFKHQARDKLKLTGTVVVHVDGRGDLGDDTPFLGWYSVFVVNNGSWYELTRDDFLGAGV
jgi:hypothetical protein